ncbi:1-acyl-sn-glycerol-3-phosphate acyltransferase [Nocardia concava]|uniref:1-acyl-sn-glycerol-3-phosphate acyltransferase n=1 Tax=Nocardia concava TaxID=257281 RepID=UPI000594BE0A|nr:1-acyl-sn-glycerol-3-phosphate acyltransferase [Nocardia concava]
MALRLLHPVSAALSSLLLLAAAPLLLCAKAILLLPGTPNRVRARARLVLLAAVFLAVFEVLGDFGVTERRPGRQGGCDLLAAQNRRLRRWGFALAGMRLVPDRKPTVPRDRPLIVLARHAGMFNSPLVAHLISTDLGRDIYCAAKTTSALTPGLRRSYLGSGVELFRFGKARGRAAAAQCMRDQAARASNSDALLIFPEGTNYTATRRRAAISALRDRGRHRLAHRAQRCRHVLPAHPAGAWTLAEAAPNADVLILAQTGLEDLSATDGRLDYPPIHTGTVHYTWWHIRAQDVPRDREQFAHWLNERWYEVDSWIAAVRGGPQDNSTTVIWTGTEPAHTPPFSDLQALEQP